MLCSQLPNLLRGYTDVHEGHKIVQSTPLFRQKTPTLQLLTCTTTTHTKPNVAYFMHLYIYQDIIYTHKPCLYHPQPQYYYLTTHFIMTFLHNCNFVGQLQHTHRLLYHYHGPSHIVIHIYKWNTCA